LDAQHHLPVQPPMVPIQIDKVPENAPAGLLDRRTGAPLHFSGNRRTPFLLHCLWQLWVQL
jgi:hypothetical protein